MRFNNAVTENLNTVVWDRSIRENCRNNLSAVPKPTSKLIGAWSHQGEAEDKRMCGMTSILAHHIAVLRLIFPCSMSRQHCNPTEGLADSNVGRIRRVGLANAGRRDPSLALPSGIDCFTDLHAHVRHHVTPVARARRAT